MIDTTIVTVIKNRPLEPTERYLKAIRAQTLLHKLIVVDYGSTEENLAWEREIIPDYGGELIEVTRNTEVFNQGRGLNIGYKATDTSYVISTDMDVLLSPTMALEATKILEGRKCMVLCQRLDLGPSDEVVGLHPKTAIGPFIGMHTRWIQKIRGIDEFYTKWGKWDDDIKKRAILDGLEIVWLNDVADVEMQHIWHPESDRSTQQVNADYLYNTSSIVRNPDGWGEL